MKNSILAMDIQKYVGYIPTALLVIGAIFLAVAFLSGFVKGGRKVRWGGLVWLATFGTYYIAGAILRDSNPLVNALSWKYDLRVINFFWDLIIALISIIVVLLVYGLLTVLFRPREEKDRGDFRQKDGLEGLGFKYDDNDDYQSYEQYQRFLEYRRKKSSMKKKKKKTSFFGRLFGAIICTVNTAMIVGIVYSAFFLIIDATALKTGFFEPIYDAKYVNAVLPFIYKYALDMAIIGVILALTLKGKSMGFIEAIRTVLVKIGSPVATVVGCYLPFSPFAESNFYLNAVVSRCVGLISSFGASETVATYGGKALACVLIIVVLVLFFWILNLLLKKLSEAVKSVLPFKAIDNALSSLVFMFLGVVVVVFIYCVCYTLSYYGILNMHEVMMGQGGLSHGLFETVMLFGKPRLGLITEYIRGYTQALPF